MEITLSLVREIPVLRLSGRLDVTSSPMLEERLKPLLGEGGTRLVFDCSGLDYVSSAGLRVFLLASRQLKGRGGGVAFAALSSPVRELFQLAGLEELFPVAGNAEGAAALPG